MHTSELDKTPLTTSLTSSYNKSTSSRKPASYDLPQLWLFPSRFWSFSNFFSLIIIIKNGTILTPPVFLFRWKTRAFINSSLFFTCRYVEGFKKFDNNNHHEPFNLRVHFHERRETHFPDVRLPITRWIVSGGNRYGRGPLRSGSPLCKPHPVQEESAFTVAVARSR